MDTGAYAHNIKGMSLPPGFLDELRSRASLTQVVGRDLGRREVVAHVMI